MSLLSLLAAEIMQGEHPTATCTVHIVRQACEQGQHEYVSVVQSSNVSNHVASWTQCAWCGARREESSMATQHAAMDAETAAQDHQAIG